MLSTIAKRLPGRKPKSVVAEVPKRAVQVVGAGAGVATIIVLSGRRRRKATVGRIVSLVRRRNSNDLNDPTLAHKVESEIFRSDDIPKGSINVNAENGVVYLRGEVSDPEQVEQIAKAARSVNGVREVKNLLHAHQG